MRGYFLKRLLLVIPTLLGISIISFTIIHLAPGDPAELKIESDQRVTGDQWEVNIARCHIANSLYRLGTKGFRPKTSHADTNALTIPPRLQG